MKGTRIVIPKSLRQDILTKLHMGYWGIERTRRRARDSVFWPGISKEIQEMINKCDPCHQYQNANPKEKLIAHEIPKRPFEQVGTDIFTYKREEYLLIADYYRSFGK